MVFPKKESNIERGYYDLVMFWRRMKIVEGDGIGCSAPFWEYIIALTENMYHLERSAEQHLVFAT